MWDDEGFQQTHLGKVDIPLMQTLESDQAQQPQLSETQTGSNRVLLRNNAEKAARLSLIPGLGQLYNGEKGRGFLFLLIFLLNTAIILGMIFAQSLADEIGKLVSTNPTPLNTEVLRYLTSAQSPATVVICSILFLVFWAYSACDAYAYANKSEHPLLQSKSMLGLTEATSGSYLLHVAVLIALLLVALFAIVKPVPEQKTQVEFLLEPPVAPKAEPSPPPKVRPVKQEQPAPAKRVATKPTKPVAPVTRPTAPDLPKDDTAPPAPVNAEPASTEQAAPSVGTATTGTSEASADGKGESQEVDLGPYLAAMQRKIKKSWFPPKGNESKKVIVQFKINASGEISKLRLITSSLLMIVDEAAISAIRNAAPFGPLPRGASDDVEIKFTFDYNVFGGGHADLRNR